MGIVLTLETGGSFKHRTARVFANLGRMEADFGAWQHGLRGWFSRNHAVEFRVERVERATGPFCRAIRPTAVRTTT
jgi:hypothetical protein